MTTKHTPVTFFFVHGGSDPEGTGLFERVPGKPARHLAGPWLLRRLGHPLDRLAAYSPEGLKRVADLIKETRG